MSKIIVGNSEYELIKTGRAQAEQSLQAVQWLSKYGTKAAVIVNEKGPGKDENGLAFLAKFVSSLTVDSVMDLFVLVTGCTAEEAEVYFDISVLIDSCLEVYKEQPALRKLIDRFFSASPSTGSTDESSTNSE